MLTSKKPGKVSATKAITGPPAGVSLAGIDFRPATGDLYGVGSDSVVYRISPATAIAVAEGPAFTPALRGTSVGFDFNPTVDKIRLTSEANQSLRLDPDAGNVIGTDGDLNPGDPQIVGSGYANSSFSATRPATTELYALDAATDAIYTQEPPNAGTLVDPKPLGVDVTDVAGFDIGPANVGYMALNPEGFGTLYRIDTETGKTKSLGRIAGGRTITGLAVVQGQA